jgi:hypothetical protein
VERKEQMLKKMERVKECSIGGNWEAIGFVRTRSALLWLKSEGQGRQ